MPRRPARARSPDPWGRQWGLVEPLRLFHPTNRAETFMHCARSCLPVGCRAWIGFWFDARVAVMLGALNPCFCRTEVRPTWVAGIAASPGISRLTRSKRRVEQA